MGIFFKEHPFKIAAGLVAAGLAAWFGWTWWAIFLSFMAGLFIGAIIDAPSDK